MEKEGNINLPKLGLKVITIIFAGTMCLAVFSQFIKPSQLVIFQWIGLFFPILFIINAILFVIWAIQKSRIAFYPLIAISINCFYYPRIFQFRPSSLLGQKEVSLPSITIASYNIRRFLMDYGGSSLLNIADLMQEKKVDILCLQEVPSDIDKGILMQTFCFMPYMSLTRQRNGNDNIVVFSRFPIRYAQSISFPERSNCTMIVDLQINGKKIRLFNCHLQTTNWNQVKEVRKYQQNSGILHLFEIESVMNRNFIYRESQADYIKKRIDESSSPLIVCGDFNVPPVSHTYTTLKGNLTDSFQKCGNGYAYTYRYFHKLLRIDYLFYSQQDFDALSYESPEVEYSDHNPVFTRLRLK